MNLNFSKNIVARFNALFIRMRRKSPLCPNRARAHLSACVCCQGNSLRSVGCAHASPHCSSAIIPSLKHKSSVYLLPSLCGFAALFLLGFQRKGHQELKHTRTTCAWRLDKHVIMDVPIISVHFSHSLKLAHFAYFPNLHIVVMFMFGINGRHDNRSPSPRCVWGDVTCLSCEL